jgi:hypothetical protein
MPQRNQNSARSRRSTSQSRTPRAERSYHCVPQLEQAASHCSLDSGQRLIAPRGAPQLGQRLTVPTRGKGLEPLDEVKIVAALSVVI